MLKLHFSLKYLHDIENLNFKALENDKKNFCVKGADMISGGPAAIPKIYRSAESQDFPINPVKTQNKSFQTYKVENKSRLRN